MFIALVVLTVLLALVSVNSAVMKLRRNERVVTSITGTVGFPERYLGLLAALEIAGAVGIVVGLWVVPLGIAAAVGLTLYFLGAIIGHLRVRDTQGVTMPLVPLILSVAVLVLRVVTA
ncbi:DoxX family protein [Cellulomonas dongxiuzhuiae]|uniref:DoxX family protein n=1 Tax=Cellulomonas dongxiuzhuiae TaxID=2819979 RepID=UPI001AAF7516|nr:DoxX family protein [Cellulomonas dongxiuzhuiae]MBO3090055.1 DoxX family protein [Cellulomonas dongxiuzhuiae]